MGLTVKIVVVAVTMLLGVAVGLTWVELSQTEESTQFQPLPISMSKAVEAAETATAGQAIIAQLDIAEGRPVYEIHILGPDRSVSTVQVDAEDGEVALVIDEEQEHSTEEDSVQSLQGGTTL